MAKTDRPLRAVLFDMDGTITRPILNFRVVREAIGLPEPLLENMLALPQGRARDQAFLILENYEQEAAHTSELNHGVKDVLTRLQEENIPSALITRNSRISVEKTLTRHGLTFSAIRSREDGPVKPDPSAVHSICKELLVNPEETLMVGDYKFDILAGKRAGTRTVLLTNGSHPTFADEIAPDHVIEKMDELLRILGQTTNR